MMCGTARRVKLGQALPVHYGLALFGRLSSARFSLVKCSTVMLGYVQQVRNG